MSNASPDTASGERGPENGPRPGPGARLLASVVVPTYNHARRLEECLDALLAQDCPAHSYEIIVVDDGSADDTARVAARYALSFANLHYIFQTNQGPAAARNKGARAARGDILVFTDDDCAPVQDWLSQMIRPFRENPAVDAVKGAYKTRQTSPAALFAQSEFEARYRQLAGQEYIDFVDTYSAAFRRDVFLKVGGFDTSYPTANNEDVEFSYRLDTLGHKIVFNPGAVVYHHHPDTLYAYLRTKFWRAYWRMVVYRSFPGKIRSDSYTPLSLKLQIVLACALAGALGASAVLKGRGLRWAGLVAALFALTALPFLAQLLHAPLLDAAVRRVRAIAKAFSPAYGWTAVSAFLRRSPLGRLGRLVARGLGLAGHGLLMCVRAAFTSRVAVFFWRLLGGTVRLLGRGLRQAASTCRAVRGACGRAIGLACVCVAAAGRLAFSNPLSRALGAAWCRVAAWMPVRVLIALPMLAFRATAMAMGVIWGLQAQLHEKSRIPEVFALLTGDVIALSLAYMGSFILREQLLGEVMHSTCPVLAYYYLYPVILAMVIVTFVFGGLYRTYRGVSKVNEFVVLSKAVLFVAVVTMVAMYLVQYEYSRFILGVFFCAALGCVSVARWMIRRSLARAPARGGAGRSRRIAIVGAGEVARLVREKLMHSLDFTGAEILGFVTMTGSESGGEQGADRVLGKVDDIGRIVEEYNITDVFVAMANASQNELMTIVDKSSRKVGVRCHVVSNIFDLITAEMDVAVGSSIPIAYLRNENLALLNLALKRVFDAAVSLLVIALTFPAWILIAAAIRLESDGPAVFRQERVGKNGRIFRILKFRTMYADTPRFAMSPSTGDDRRISVVGRFLRKTSLDELPQLVNVLKGDMSIVGPRPEMPFIVERYSEWERQRLKAKPGLTGLWQIMGRKDLPMHESIEYDFYYIKNQSLLLDLVIILKTIPVVLTGKGAY